MSGYERPNLFDLFGCHGCAFVAPVRAHVGKNCCNLLVVVEDGAKGRHRIIKLRTADLNRARKTVKHNTNDSVGPFAEHPVGTGQRRILARHTLSGGLVTGYAADIVENLFAQGSQAVGWVLRMRIDDCVQVCERIINSLIEFAAAIVDVPCREQERVTTR